MTTTLPPLPGTTGAASGPTPAPPRAPRARRRSPAVLALAVALVAAGGLGGAVLYNETGQRTAVLALAQNVPAGEMITASDLTVAHISLDPALDPVGAASLENVIGMRATTNLMTGQFLTSADVTRASLVQANQQVVGIAVKDVQIPSQPLEPGTHVMIVENGINNPSPPPPIVPPVGTQVPATVIAVGAPDSAGEQVIDMSVPSAASSQLAVMEAYGGFSVVFAPQGGG
jgi:hypothetical protein